MLTTTISRSLLRWVLGLGGLKQAGDAFASGCLALRRIALVPSPARVHLHRGRFWQPAALRKYVTVSGGLRYSRYGNAKLSFVNLRH